MSDEDAAAIASAGWELIPEADAGKAPVKPRVKAKAPAKARVKARDW